MGDNTHRSGASAERTEGARASEALLAGMFNISHDGIMAFRSIRGDDGSISDFEWTVVNPASEAIVGRTSADLVGKRLLEEMPGNAESGLFDRYAEVVETGRPYTVEHHYVHEGLDNWFLTTAVKLDDGFTATLRDVSEQKRLQGALEQQALHDPLTGLPNRLLLQTRIARALDHLRRRPASIAVLFIDLDRFKVVNDGLGHAAGDALLAQVGQRLRAAARPGDTVARFGGDEFVVVCEDLATSHATNRVAQRLLEIGALPVLIDGREIRVTLSIGVVTTQDPDADPVALVRDADAAIYRAKANGGGRVEFFDDDLRHEVIARLDTEVELRRGIDRGELRVHYQPVVSVADHRIVAVEALVRWQHPEHGLLLPGRFIAVAEETGLIVPLGAVVLDQAVRQLAAWRRTTTSAPEFVSVNLAASQLALPGFAGTVADLLAEVGLSPTALCLEVTETSLIRDPITAHLTLQELAAQGVRIALDDFGVGYFSLAHLQRLPVDVIKIDQSFVAALEHSHDDRALVGALIKLADALGKTTVAEGVETTRQLEVLAELGADLVQGFHFSPAVDPDELVGMLARMVPV